jgi:hypothetical protein
MEKTLPEGMPYVSKEDRGQRLTFGVELEFLVAHLESRFEADPDPEDERERTFAPLSDYVELPRHPDKDELGRSTLEDGEVGDEGRKPPTKVGAWIRHRIATLLRSHGIPAVSDSGDDETVQVIKEHIKDARERLNFDPDPKVPLPDNIPTNFDKATYWNVATDSSLGESIALQYKYSPVEIQSPIFYYDERSIQLVKFVVNLIVSEFRIFNNYSAMLHVHVGRGNRGYSMNDLRMISSVLYAAAPRLDQLHPVHCGPTTEWAPGSRALTMMANLNEADAHQAHEERLAPSEIEPLLTAQDNTSGAANCHGYIQHPTYLAASLFAHPLLQQWPGRQRAAMFGVSRIWRADNIDELYESVSSVYVDPNEYEYTYRAAYNFRHLKEKPEDKKTIEFRQHAGTMSASAIENWIRVTAGIVDFCVHAPFVTTIGDVLRKLDQPDPNAAESERLNAENIIGIDSSDPPKGDIGGSEYFL